MNLTSLNSLSYGIYAIGVKGETYPSASIVNTVFQVTSSPAIIAVSINNKNYTNKCIKKSKLFTVSVLSEDTPGTIIGALGFTSGKEVNKLKNINHKILNNGLPVIEEKCCCWFECEVTDSIETSTHTIFLAKITNSSDKTKRTPMTYSYYQNVIKGSAPKNAPTYQEKFESSNSDAYVCTLCGYVYRGKISFTDLPEDWICPICSAPKSVFKLK